MWKLFIGASLTLPFFASAATDTCAGDGYTVSVHGKTATVSGGGIKAGVLKSIPSSGAPEDKGSWPEFANDDGSIDLTYFNAVNPNSSVSKTKFTARLEVGDRIVNLVCDNP